MAEAPFRDKKTEKFMEDSMMDGLEGDNLLLDFQKDITQENIFKGTNDNRQKAKELFSPQIYTMRYWHGESNAILTIILDYTLCHDNWHTIENFSGVIFLHTP